MNLLIFTEAEKDRAESLLFVAARLQGFPLVNGTEWVMPPGVITASWYANCLNWSDPTYATAQDWLASLPQRDVDPETEFPPPPEDGLKAPGGDEES